MEPTDIGPTDVLVPTARSRMIGTVIGAAGTLALMASWSNVGSSSGLAIATACGCIAGVCTGVAMALQPYQDKISPWSVIGGLLGTLGVALIGGLALGVRHRSDVGGSSIAWVSGWAGLLYGVAFWLIALPMLIKAKRRARGRSTDLPS